MWPDFRKQPLYAVLVAIILIAGIAWQVVSVATKMRAYRSIAPSQRQLTVSGTGKVRGTPDVAIVTAGFTVQGVDVRATQDGANKKMSALVAAIKGAGVADADIQTAEFSINPQYVYTPQQPPRINGFEARQSIEIRIRNLDHVNTVLAAASGAGATNIGGLRLTIDDPALLQGSERGRAIADARVKAAIIASQLGVRRGRAVSFGESGGGMPMMYGRMLGLDGIGGGESAPMPAVEKGSNEIVTNVNVTYELE